MAITDFLDIDPRAPEQYRKIVSATWARRNPQDPRTTAILLHYAGDEEFMRLFKMVETINQSFSGLIRKRLGQVND